MKRKHAVLLILALLIASLPHIGLCEPYHIVDLVREAPERWTGEYDVGGETIRIDAPVFVPDVNTVPILRVARVMANEDGVKSIQQSGAETRDYNIYEVSFDRNDYAATYTDLGYFSYVEECLNDFWAISRQGSANAVFSKNQSVSVQEIEEWLGELVLKLYGDQVGVQIQKVELMSSYQISKKPGTYESGAEFPYGDLTGVGGYLIYANQVLRGIPVLLPVSGGFSIRSLGDTAFWEEMNSAQSEITLYYMNDKYYQFLAWNTLNEVDEIQADVPLCEFERIKSSLEEQIRNGNIHNVYSLQLGYVIYADPEQEYGRGDKTVKYLLVPTWVARCSYTGGKEARDPLDRVEAYDYTKNDADFQSVLVNAQTGEVYDPMASETQKYYAPSILR